MNDKELTQYLSDRNNAIKKDPDSIDKIIDKNSLDSILIRKKRFFYDECYKRNFPFKSVEERKFLNIGPGSFHHKYWRTADKLYGREKISWTQGRRGVKQRKPDYEWDIFNRDPLNEEDNYFDVIYTSHVIEHAFDEDIRFLFRDVLRLLKPGSVFRIVCPDADLFSSAYQRKDWDFFMDYLCVRTDRINGEDYSIDELSESGYLAKFLLSFFSLITEEENSTPLNNQECLNYIKNRPTILSAIEDASKLSDRSLAKKLGAHVNWFNATKLQHELLTAGFKKVTRSGYLQSHCAILRDESYFDKTDPQMSLYFEAIK